MAARTPRRSFATPFVVTLAVAPACYVQSSPRSPQPTTPQPSTQEPATTTTPDSKPPTVMVNPPRPQATTPNGRWRIYSDANQNGACFSQPAIKCPPNVACNPPRPVVYECPTNIDLKSSGGATVISSADGMTCQIEFPPMNCPVGAACNPPPPTPVTCPRP